MEETAVGSEPFGLVELTHVPEDSDGASPEHWEIVLGGIVDTDTMFGVQHTIRFDPRKDILDELLETVPNDIADGVRGKIEEAVRPPKQRQTLSTSGALYQQVATIKKALVDANDPVPLFFRRQGQIVTVHRTDDGRPTFRSVPDVASLRAISSWAADWQNRRAKGAG